MKWSRNDLIYESQTMNRMKATREEIETKITDLEGKYQKMITAVRELSNEVTTREKKLREITKIINNGGDLVESFYRIKIILDN